MGSTTAGSFDIRGPLPTGTTLLEASAGTGKTWTIAALVTRYVAEGHAGLDELLVVTFGRAASQELRERVRDQLVEAERAVADPTAPRPASELLDHLLDCDDEERALRHKRLRQALGDFDAATIATIHQFCQQVLRSLGVAGDTDADATLVEDLDDLLTEVVDDLYLRGFAGREDQPPFSRGEALSLGRAAALDPQATLEPAAAVASDPESVPALRVRFGLAVRRELDARKRALGLLSYDDLLGQLAHALREPGSPACARMQARWKVALVDEFQDTDPVQWQVFERAFSGAATMVLIGDPKQAIYAFRGGDVHTYLAAAETAGTRQTLAVNWRSDSALLDRLQVFLRGAALGDPRIVVHDVRAHHEGTRLEGAGDPLRLRVVRPGDLGRSPRSKLAVATVRDHLWEDVARDIRRLLTSGATFEGRRVAPRDVAVIAYKHSDLAAIQAALGRLGVPAVVGGSGSVFHTAAATEWLALLEALEQPHRTPRVRAAALTPFLGYGAAELDAGGDELTDRIAEQVRTWSDLVAGRGVAAVLEAAVATGMTARLLARTDGERLLTDLRHIGQVLHRVSVEERLGLVALLGWLREQIADERKETAGERTRRLDSDAAAVQLVTIHGSKGLQYPVVYLPTLWDRFESDPRVPLFHDEEGHRCRNVGGGGPGWSEHVARHKAEDCGEALRLLYVALTRAQSQVVAWYAPTPRNTPGSALHRILFGRLHDAVDVPDSHPLEDDERLLTKLEYHRTRGALAWEPAAWAEVTDEEIPHEQPELAVRDFTRAIDTAWRRTSYSALSKAGEEAAATGSAVALSEPEDPPKDDEAMLPVVEPVGRTSAQAVPSPMATLPVGATFGSLVHAVLEHADPRAPDLRQELLSHIDEQLVWWPVTLDREELADALVAVCDSPLGPLVGERTLRDIPMSDRLVELDFELPLAGGDLGPSTGPGPSPTAGRDVTLGQVAPLLRRHLPDGDPLRAYADALDAPGLGGQPLKGYLTGSVDVLLRVPPDDAAGETRYFTVDYKTNWLGGHDEPLTSDAYRPDLLAAAMGHSDYPLQALLYTVVQHRYLRWRLPGYDPGRHLGGVLYLYLRGMCGPETPRADGMPCGVFAWRPPVGLVVELSDLLDGMVPTGSTEEAQR
jgi:exodeoxyribonuclease V beta subunit